MLMGSAKNLVPPFLVRPLKAGRSLYHHQRHTHGLGRPWDSGYLCFRDAFLARTLDDTALVRRIASGADLPADYGVGVDERAIEIPWLVGQEIHSFERFLDAGSALNHEYFVDRVELPREMHILTLGPESKCFWSKGISYLFGDLRDMPVRDGFYDAVACISTLEHVGLDTSLFTERNAAQDRADEGMYRAMREFHRILKPNGTLFLTVPYGKRQDFSWLRQFDAGRLDAVLAQFGPTSSIAKRFYRYTDRGWNSATAEDCVDSEFVAWLGRRHFPKPIPVEPDRAAAARAVACVTATKK